jgi:hypothetical protein
MLSEYNNIQDQINDMLGIDAAEIDLVDGSVDMDTQIEYLEHPRDFKEVLSDEDIINSKDGIFSPSVSIERKKDLFVQLASVNDIQAYTAIKAYVNKEFTDLEDWAKLALQESGMLLKSAILDENVVLISTGLGGEENMLRYFVVLISKEGEEINSFRRKLLKSELQYVLKRNNSKLEDIEFTNDFSSALCLIPLNESLQDIFSEFITECNNFGGFIRSNIIINNTKVLSCDEIYSIINENF